MKIILLNLIPGVSEFIKRNYLKGFAKLSVYSGALLLSFYFWSIEGVISASFIAALSNIYRNYHARYMLNVKHSLEILGSGKLLKIGNMTHEAISESIIKRPVWWLPVLNWPVIPIGFVVMFLIFLANETEFSFVEIINGYSAAAMVMQGMFSPNWALLNDAIFIYAKQTVETALLGSAIGMVISLPISFFAARNLMNSNPIVMGLYYVTRGFMVIVRAIPTFLLGLVFVALVGIGPFPGVLAIFVFSVGVMTKLYSEIIESIDQGPMDGVIATGANTWQVVLFSVIPQALPGIIAATLYCIEINIHSATVLGLIGAEGIGLPIHEYLSSLSYSNASTFIVVTIVLTVIVDYSSAFLRSRIK